MKIYMMCVAAVVFAAGCKQSPKDISGDPVLAAMSMCGAGISQGLKAEASLEYKSRNGKLDADFFMYLKGFLDPDKASNEKYSKYVECVLAVYRENRQKETVASSEWLTSSQYQSLWDKKSSEGFYPTTLIGQCSEGGEIFSVEKWKVLPLGASFHSYHAMTEANYSSRQSELNAKGYALVFISSFDDCSGTKRYQATWFKQS